MDELSATYDVVVIGGGHAGCEAAAAAARVGARTALLTHKRATIGEMSCNPAIGGLAKGHLVREIDALDGRDGPRDRQRRHPVPHAQPQQGAGGARAPGPGRSQALSRVPWRRCSRTSQASHILEGAAEDLRLDAEGRVCGLVLGDGGEIAAGRVVLTTGTFLGGLIHIGEEKIAAGRVGEAPSLGLSQTLRRCGFALGRLKTGTPPRLDGRRSTGRGSTSNRATIRRCRSRF